MQIGLYLAFSSQCHFARHSWLFIVEIPNGSVVSRYRRRLSRRCTNKKRLNSFSDHLASTQRTQNFPEIVEKQVLLESFLVVAKRLVALVASKTIISSVLILGLMVPLHMLKVFVPSGENQPAMETGINDAARFRPFWKRFPRFLFHRYLKGEQNENQ